MVTTRYFKNISNRLRYDVLSNVSIWLPHDMFNNVSNRLRYDVLSNVSIWLPHDMFNKVLNRLQYDVLGNISTYVWRQLGDGFLCDASVSTHVSHANIVTGANHVLLIQTMALQFCNLSSNLYLICLITWKQISIVRFWLSFS